MQGKTGEQPQADLWLTHVVAFVELCFGLAQQRHRKREVKNWRNNFNLSCTFQAPVAVVDVVVELEGLYL